MLLSFVSDYISTKPDCCFGATFYASVCLLLTFQYAAEVNDLSLVTVASPGFGARGHKTKRVILLDRQPHGAECQSLCGSELT